MEGRFHFDNNNVYYTLYITVYINQYLFGIDSHDILKPAQRIGVKTRKNPLQKMQGKRRHAKIVYNECMNERIYEAGLMDNQPLSRRKGTVLR